MTYQSSLVVDQTWLGTILEVYNDSFLARLTLESDPQTSKEVVVSNDQVFSASRALIQTGASFTWTVGKLETEQDRKPISMIRLLRS